MSDTRQVYDTEKKIAETVAAISALVPAYAQARQIIDYDSDRRKQLLARYMAAEGPKSSMSAADANARASNGYSEELDKLASSLKYAYEVVARWQALHARLDAARSILALTRETMKL
jgi:hypothetical protein